MPLKRVEHWDTRAFHNFSKLKRTTPFTWGEWDCCLAAASFVQAITGTDIGEDFRGKYTDEASAMTTIASVTGGKTIEDAIVWVAKKYDLAEHTHPLLAKRGDLVLVKNNDGNLIAGVVHLTGRHVLTVGPKGAAMLSIMQIHRAWKI